MEQDAPAPMDTPGTTPDADRKARARTWFEGLRDRICAAFEALEDRVHHLAEGVELLGGQRIDDEVPDELAYQMAKLLYANLDALKAAHSAANDIDPMKAAQNLPVPLHPGAARYYQEAGVPIE